jgi:hypothetical protein
MEGRSYHGGAETYHTEVQYLKDGNVIKTDAPETANSLGEANKLFQRSIRLAFTEDYGQDEVWVHLFKFGKPTKFKSIKKNPRKKKNPGSLAEEISEGFHGRKVREELEIEEEELIPDNTAVLGCLLDITVTRDDGKTGIPIIFLRDGQKPKRGEEVYVCAPDRNNIEFIGGNQDIGNFSVLAKGDKDKQFVSLGKVESLAYLADKHHLQGSNGKEEPYEHSFGRKRFFVFGKRVGRPELLYDTRNCKISLVGGTYTIEDEGITN